MLRADPAVSPWQHNYDGVRVYEFLELAEGRLYDYLEAHAFIAPAVEPAQRLSS